MVDFMEIETAFHTLVGVIIVAIVIIATIVIAMGILRGGRTIYLQECIPADYVTDSMAPNSVICGVIGTPGGPKSAFCKDSFDTCMDPSTNKCCNTSDVDVAYYSRLRCCRSNCSAYTDEKNCTDVSCKWCSSCSGNTVNRWFTNKCVAPGVNCDYKCVKTWCNADCEINADCPLTTRCSDSCKCKTILIS